jgi:hypothetical protein
MVSTDIAPPRLLNLRTHLSYQISVPFNRLQRASVHLRATARVRQSPQPNFKNEDFAAEIAITNFAHQTYALR